MSAMVRVNGRGTWLFGVRSSLCVPTRAPARDQVSKTHGLWWYAAGDDGAASFSMPARGETQDQGAPQRLVLVDREVMG